METPELVFGKYSKNASFLRDLGLTFNLSKEKAEKVIEVYLASEYRTYHHQYLDEFSEKIGLDFDDAHSLSHILDIFAYFIIPKNKPENIEAALVKVLDTYNDETMRYILSKLSDNDTQDLLDTLDRIDDEIGEINPHFAGIIYSIQNRAVIKDKKVIKKFPVATIEIGTSKDRSYIFDMLEKDIDFLIEDLKDIKQELNLLKE